jgi:putative oxidoreductase
MGRDLVLLCGRLLISVFFAVELVDKITRFGEWVEFLAASGMPAPAAEMALVVLLLSTGCVSLITGVRVRLGVACLLIFLVPTAALFESSAMAVKSISVAGGLVLLWVTGPGRLSLGAPGRDGS